MSQRTQDIAERLYIEMVARVALDPSDLERTRKFNPDAIARLSFKLAEAFVKASDVNEGDPANTPAKYEVQLSDIAGWDK